MDALRDKVLFRMRSTNGSVHGAGRLETYDLAIGAAKLPCEGYSHRAL